MVKILSILLILLAIIAITYGRSAEYKIAINQRVNIGANANSEDDNTGEDNTDEGNTGEGNTGEDNTGEDNTGEDNTGEDNTGEDNTGEDNTGEDNTGEGDIDGVKNLQDLTEENSGIKQELNETKQSLDELTEENNGIKQELKTTKQSLVALEKKFEDYKAAFFTRFSELFYEMNRVKSCRDVPKTKGTTRDGSYVIQPDPSLPAFDVECSFNGSTATTTIHHNSEEEVEVSNCGGRKCYGRNIVYDATIPQIRALISLSGKCRQYIKYRCHGSVIFQNGGNYAGWETWNGTMKHYWGGSGGRDGYCACGVTGTCADTNYKCNCDKNDEVWCEDSGLLDQEEDLPATKVYFGDTDASNEHGHHTLGSLQCQQSL